VAEREEHRTALGLLLHLLDHVPEHREPVAYVAGARAYRVRALRWAAAQLDRGWHECPAADCTDPDHVTLIDRAIQGEEEGG
jgi:hypothetical protein